MSYINPPLNFTGSKYKLLDQILPKMDYSKNNFIDIFTGGGSVYTNVLDKYETIFINDVITDLVKIHRSLAKTPQSIIDSAKSLSMCKDDKEKYLKLREDYNNNPSPDKLWALMLSCNSNLMRFNKSFKFNQTWGKRQWNDNTTKKTESYVEHLSLYKDKIKYMSKSFIDVPIREGFMYYLDPPYINSEAGYNSYWSSELEQKLYDYIIDIDKIGSSFMLSGVLTHDGVQSELLTKLSKDYICIELNYNYDKISKKGKKETKEVIIINYES
jgi:DNA adenine methylase Dam